MFAVFAARECVICGLLATTCVMNYVISKPVLWVLFSTAWYMAVQIYGPCVMCAKERGVLFFGLLTVICGFFMLQWSLLCEYPFHTLRGMNSTKVQDGPPKNATLLTEPMWARTAAVEVALMATLCIQGVGCVLDTVVPFVAAQAGGGLDRLESVIYFGFGLMHMAAGTVFGQLYYGTLPRPVDATAECGLECVGIPISGLLCSMVVHCVCWEELMDLRCEDEASAAVGGSAEAGAEFMYRRAREPTLQRRVRRRRSLYKAYGILRGARAYAARLTRMPLARQLQVIPEEEEGTVEAA